MDAKIGSAKWLFLVQAGMVKHITSPTVFKRLTNARRPLQDLMERTCFGALFGIRD